MHPLELVAGLGFYLYKWLKKNTKKTQLSIFENLLAPKKISLKESNSKKLTFFFFL